MTEEWHFLFIEKGNPFLKGDRVRLKPTDMIIGRAGKGAKPDIPFDSLYVSRRHAQISWDGRSFQLRDLGSKHGTIINGRQIEPGRPCRLANGDEISLAHGIITMSYQVLTDFDDQTMTLTRIVPKSLGEIAVNPDCKEVRIEGEQINFSGKERDLMLLLYRSANKAVSYDEIKKELWPERLQEGLTVPEVGSDEVTCLVYRLRKRLGRHGDKIVTVPRYGVFLKLD